MLSTYNPRSLDSRYIGPIQADTVIAGMTPVFVFNQKKTMRLIVAEKPSVAKAIAEELGVASRGNGFFVCKDG